MVAQPKVELEENGRSLIREAVERALREANGDSVKAASILEKIVMSDSDLYHQLMDGQVARQCWEQIRHYFHAKKRILWTQPNTDAKHNSEKVEHLAKANLSNLLSFRLFQAVFGLQMQHQVPALYQG